MIVTGAELTGLSVISGGGHLPGLPVLVTGKGQALDAMQGLRAKGVVDTTGQVTRWGRVPVRVVDQYRRADRHVFINQLKVSVNSDGMVTVLHPAPQGWFLARVNPVWVMVVLLRTYPFLREGGDTPTSPWQPLTETDWALDHPDGAELMVVRHTSKSHASSVVVAYDWRGGTGFAFDMTAGRGRRLPAWQIRSHLADLLGCQPAPETGASHG